MYLQKYWSYRDVLYLKIILKQFYFDRLKSSFALEGMIWAVETKICDHFFLKKKSYINVCFGILFFQSFQCISESILATKMYYT